MKKLLFFAFMPVTVALFIWACGEAEVVKDFADMDGRILVEKCIQNPAADPACASMLAGIDLSSSSGGINPPPGGLDSVKVAISCPNWGRGLTKSILYVGDNINPAPPACMLEVDDVGQQKLDSLGCDLVTKLYVSATNDLMAGTEVLVQTVPSNYANQYLFVTAYAKCGNSSEKKLPSVDGKDLTYEIRESGASLDGNCTFYDGETVVSTPMKWSNTLTKPSLKLSLVSGSDFDCTINGRSIADGEQLIEDDFDGGYAVGTPTFPGTVKPNSTGNPYTYKTYPISCAVEGAPPITIDSKECTLIVNDGSCNADENKVKNDFCGGRDPQYNTTNIDVTSPGCYFVKSFDQIVVGKSSSFKVNGVTCTCSNKPNGDCNAITDCKGDAQKSINGGYYIQTIKKDDWPGGGVIGTVVASGPPACLHNTPVCKISELPQIKAGSGNKLNDANAKVTCGTNGTPEAPLTADSWKGGIDWTNPAMGKYNVKVDAKCNGGIEEADCGEFIIYPSNSDVTNNLKWDNVRPNAGGAQGTNLTGIFFIGDNPTHNSGVTDNGGICQGSIVYKGSSERGNWTLGTPLTASHLGANSTPGTITISATCNVPSIDANFPLATINAQVVPNPSYEGNCTWDKIVTSPATGAKPQGVSITNTYGRCGTTSADGSRTDGVLKTTEYKADGGGTLTTGWWPNDGKANLGTYPAGNVKAGITCSAPITGDPKNCPQMEVRNYTVEIGNQETVWTPGGDKPESGQEYAVLSMGNCTNVRFNTSWQPTNDMSRITVKVNDSPAVGCSDTNDNCSNLVVTPKPQVGYKIVVQDAKGLISNLKCDNW